jgi:hypothetical protein
VGLYRQGLLHDLSKYSPTEFWVGARYFQGNRSPNNAEREDIGYSNSWLHHKGRNRHHFEYWVDYNLRGKEGESPLVPVKMPGRYVVEMFMDRIAASKIYMGDAYTDAAPLKYFDAGSAVPHITGEPERHAKEMSRYTGSFCERPRHYAASPEWELICTELARNDGNRSVTAQKLGISRGCLNYQIKKHSAAMSS